MKNENLNNNKYKIYQWGSNIKKSDSLFCKVKPNRDKRFFRILHFFHSCKFPPIIQKNFGIIQKMAFLGVCRKQVTLKSDTSF